MESRKVFFRGSTDFDLSHVMFPPHGSKDLFNLTVCFFWDDQLGVLFVKKFQRCDFSSHFGSVVGVILHKFFVKFMQVGQKHDR